MEFYASINLEIEDMELVGVRKEDIDERDEWRQMIHCGVHSRKNTNEKTIVWPLIHNSLDVFAKTVHH